MSLSTFFDAPKLTPHSQTDFEMNLKAKKKKKCFIGVELCVSNQPLAV